ncbi:MAG: inner membrane protein [Acidobacteria bacterium]|nr:MAG: inner membrane protein [Acidobacteriota bacterium]
MTDVPGLSLSLPFKIKSRSIGLKLIVVCGLAMLMLIPALLVGGLVEDRRNRASDVIKDISSHVGGQQTFLGPTLAIPYTVPPQYQSESAIHGMYLVFPARASANVKTTTQERHRSLFKVPVFQADAKLDATFDLSGVPGAAPQRAEFDWSRAEIVVGVSDARGALSDALLSVEGKNFTLAPSQIAQTVSISGGQNSSVGLVLLGTKIDDLAKPDKQFNVSSSLRFSGAQRIAVLAYGKTTHVTAQGDWPNPGFDGGFLPATRTVSGSGYTAEWSLPFIARGVRAEGVSDTITGLDATALGVSFIEVADPYQSVNRSVKYVPLFLGLVFLSYFIFEVTTGKRIHPAQYILVGIAQIIFYLLLLALAERIGFDFAFLLAGSATVVLLSTNAGWIFSSRRYGARALILFTAMYVLIYTLLRLEDNSLLVGAIASFVAVAAAMYFTRKIDWYSSLPETVVASKPPENPA